MRIDVLALPPGDDRVYSAVVARSEHALLHHSPKYRSFLARVMPNSRSTYLVALEDGEPTAAMPTFARSGAFGTVVNSLPFFGSHGGIIATPAASAEARRALVEEFHSRNAASNTAWATLITSPVGPDIAELLTPLPDFTDERIGQLTPLPSAEARESASEALMSQYHQKTRNMVRKGLKAGYQLSHDSSEKALTELCAMHQENMRTIGAVAKEWEVFEAIRATFAYDEDYRIYRADTDEGDCASIMLVFYFKHWVEYFVPCSAAEHRSNQPLSALIHKAMVDSVVERGSRWWNWGGTWLSQEGVYRFKSRWGTIDRHYKYLIWAYQDAPDPARLHRAQLAKEYPYFYTLPYALLDDSLAPAPSL